MKPAAWCATILPAALLTAAGVAVAGDKVGFESDVLPLRTHPRFRADACNIQLTGNSHHDP